MQRVTSGSRGLKMRPPSGWKWRLIQSGGVWRNKSSNNRRHNHNPVVWMNQSHGDVLRGSCFSSPDGELKEAVSSDLQNSFSEQILVHAELLIETARRGILTREERWSDKVRWASCAPSGRWWGRWSGWSCPDPSHQPGCRWGCCCRATPSTPGPGSGEHAQMTLLFWLFSQKSRLSILRKIDNFYLKIFLKNHKLQLLFEKLQ